ncbi:MAG: hypothetical protein KBC33_02635 [Candidatus Pacebacteria bacterium]|nr:hypothetical protein [Candidatus Paceibacterota bacterium]
MRNSWNEDSEYIVNLTRQLIGKTALDTIIKENRKACMPTVLHSYILAVVGRKINEMNDSTLGRICAYASSDGAHGGKHFRDTERPKFINRTGLNDVITPGMNYLFKNLGVGQHLELIAIAVITCVVVDMMFQDNWQKEWDSLVMTETEEEVSRTSLDS